MEFKRRGVALTVREELVVSCVGHQKKAGRIVSGATKGAVSRATFDLTLCTQARALFNCSFGHTKEGAINVYPRNIGRC